MNPVCMSKHPSRNNTWCDRAPSHVGPHRDSDGFAWEVAPAGSYTRTDEDSGVAAGALTGSTLAAHFRDKRDMERARAEKAEQERDEARREREDLRASLKEANAALRASREQPVDITDEMVERGWFNGGAGPWDRGRVRAILTAALTESTRPEGAEDIETDLRPLDLGGVATPEQVADHLAALGYRKTGAES